MSNLNSKFNPTHDEYEYYFTTELSCKCGEWESFDDSVSRNHLGSFTYDENTKTYKCNSCQELAIENNQLCEQNGSPDIELRVISYLISECKCGNRETQVALADFKRFSLTSTCDSQEQVSVVDTDAICSNCGELSKVKYTQTEEEYC